MRISLHSIYLTVILLAFTLRAYAQVTEGQSVDPYALADKYFEARDFVRAEAEYRKALEAYPGHAQGYNNLGLIASSNDARIKESIVYFMKAIKLDPEYPDAFANLGVICSRIGDNDRAVDYLKRACELGADNGNYFYTLGWIYISGKNDNEKGMEALKKAIELDPSLADAHYLLGLAYAEKGEKSGMFEEITALRMAGRTDLAEALEGMIRPKPLKDGDIKNTPPVRMSYGVSLVKKDVPSTTVPPQEEPKQIGTGKLSGTVGQIKGSGYSSAPVKRKVKIKGTATTSSSGTIQPQLSGAGTN